jgi:glycosyltransferase involved in cell wall biosynthesis
MKRILYITRANPCLRRAHSHNIVSTVSLLNKSNDVCSRLVTSGKFSCSISDVFSRHGVEKKFSIDIVKIISLYLIKNRHHYDLIYFRDPRLLVSLSIARILGKKVIFEVHGSREWRGLNWLWQVAYNFSTAHIFITNALAADYEKSTKPRAFIPPVGVNLEDFKTTAKSEGKYVLLYIGSSERYYDLMLLVKMLKLLHKNVYLRLVGIKQEEADVLKKEAAILKVAERLEVMPRVNHHEIPGLLCAADVLLNPKVRGYAGSVSSKLYSYLAAGKPIVASVVPADAEVVTEKNSLIVEATATAFADAISQLINNKDLAERISKQAKNDAIRYSTLNRSTQLMDFIKQI